MGTRLALATIGAMLAVCFITALPPFLGVIAVFPCAVFISTALFCEKL